MGKKALHTTGVGRLRWDKAAIALGYILGRAGLAEGQVEGKITVLSPTRDDEIHAGDTVMVSFNATGEAEDGPYYLDLFKGANQIFSWCEEGCEIDGGSLTVIVSSSFEAGPGYFVLVTDQISSISGESQVFELLPQLPSNSSGIDLIPEYQEEISAGGSIGDMNLALVIVASVCGLALVCTVFVACIMVSRRKAALELEMKENMPDFELGGPLDRATPGRGYESHSSDGRSFNGGNSIMRNRSFSVGGSLKSFADASPARSMAMGDQQRGRSQSRDSTGPRMYSSNTPSRARASSTSPAQDGGRFGSYDGGGGAMVVVTPGRSNSGRSGRSRTPRRLMSGGDTSRGRQMYDRSSVPSWDESGGRMMATSRSPGRGLVARPESTGRLRRPPRYMMQGGDPGDANRAGRVTMTPGRRRSTRDGQAGSPHILGIRRSKSAGHGLARQGDEDAAAVGEGGRWEDRGMMAAVGKMERGRRSQRSLGKQMRSKSMHDTSDGRQAAMSNGSADPYGRERRSRSKPTTPSRRQSYSRSGMGERDDPSTNSDVSWEELRSTYLKSKNSSRRSYALPSYGDAVHHADEGDSVDGRAPPPSYGPRDAESSSEHLSIGIPNDPSPSSYKSTGRRPRSSRFARSNGTGSSKKSSGSYSNRSPSKSPNSGRFSPSTRAVSARKAARDAQLSAERALAAAAMASRAADLAAQAALEAEAEADAELIDDDLDSFEEVEMSPPSKSSSGVEVEGSMVREKIKVFSGGSTLGSSITSFDKESRDEGRAAVKSPFGRRQSDSWTQAVESEVTGKAEQTSAGPKEALASMVNSNGGGGGGGGGGERGGDSNGPTNSWVKNGVGGPDTAGGSTSATGHADTGDGDGDGGDDRNGFTSMTVSAPAHALSSDPKELAMRRKAFVKQYSGASDLADDSDYSLHDNAAAAAIAAVVGRPGIGHARVGSATVMPWDKTSLDGSGSMSYGREEPTRAGDLVVREDSVADSEGQGVPKRGRPESSDRGRSADRERFAGKSRPSPVAGSSH